MKILIDVGEWWKSILLENVNSIYFRAVNSPWWVFFCCVHSLFLLVNTDGISFLPPHNSLRFRWLKMLFTDEMDLKQYHTRAYTIQYIVPGMEIKSFSGCARGGMEMKNACGCMSFTFYIQKKKKKRKIFSRKVFIIWKRENRIMSLNMRIHAKISPAIVCSMSVCVILFRVFLFEALWNTRVKF